MKKVTWLAGALFALVMAGTANAGIMCDSRYANNTIQNLGCELGSTNNDFLADPLQVNVDQMFGFDDWEYVWKDEVGPPLPEGLASFELNTNLLSGSFSINWATPAQGQVMFVLKDGMDDPDTFVGWLLDPGSFGLQEYAFNTPFLNTSTGELKQISHATFYYRNGGPTTLCVDCEPNNVPVSATMPLMAIGGLGLLWARRRKVA